MTLRGTLLAAGVAIALTGCQSQWYLQNEAHSLITTDVIIHSNPSGAEIRWDSVRIGVAPVKMPVEYDHVEQLWARQSNVGARMREDWGTFATIIGFPIWLPASLFHETEDRRVHVYGHNTFEINARLPGHVDGYRTLKLEGEEEVEVRVNLDPR